MESGEWSIPESRCRARGAAASLRREVARSRSVKAVAASSRVTYVPRAAAARLASAPTPSFAARRGRTAPRTRGASRADRARAQVGDARRPRRHQAVVDDDQLGRDRDCGRLHDDGGRRPCCLYRRGHRTSPEARRGTKNPESALLPFWRSDRVGCRRCLLRVIILWRAALSKSLSRQCLLLAALARTHAPVSAVFALATVQHNSVHDRPAMRLSLPHSSGALFAQSWESLEIGPKSN